MGEKVKYVRFRFTGTLEDLNEIKEEVEEVMKGHGWKRGFSEMAPLDANPEIYDLATGWKRFKEEDAQRLP